MKPFSQRPQLAVMWSAERLSLCSFIKNRPEAAVFWNQSHDETVAAMPDAPRFTTLILPRSEVIQKGITAGECGMDLSRLERILPFSPDQMAYSVVLESEEDAANAKGLVYAIPEQKIIQIIDKLSAIGIQPEEVITEDQAFFWMYRDKAEAGPIMVIDRDTDRSLAIILSSGGILWSHAYAPTENDQDVISEASYAAMENGIRPVDTEKVVMNTDSKTGAPLALEGVQRKKDDDSVISLLPNDLKLAVQKKRKLKDWRHLMAAATLATACVSVLASLHIVFLHQKSESNERQIAVWSSKLERIRRMESSLEAFAQAETSRGRFMGLLSELSASTPGSVVLKELRIEQDGVALKGEIESQSMLNETLQSFQEIKGLRDVKLEHSRLRKRLNREFFEFEINAQWSD